MDNKKVASELVRLAKKLTASEKKAFEGKFYITVDDKIDYDRLEELAELNLHDPEYDNYDVYSDDKRGLMGLIKDLKNDGIKSSRIMNA
jgi:hypothetical protein